MACPRVVGGGLHVGGDAVHEPQGRKRRSVAPPTRAVAAEATAGISARPPAEGDGHTDGAEPRAALRARRAQRDEGGEGGGQHRIDEGGAGRLAARERAPDRRQPADDAGAVHLDPARGRPAAGPLPLGGRCVDDRSARSLGPAEIGAGP